MAWILGETGLGDPECELVELGLVMPTETLTIRDTRRSKPRAVNKEAQSASDSLRDRWTARRRIGDSLGLVDSLRDKWAAVRAFGESMVGKDAVKKAHRTIERDSMPIGERFGQKGVFYRRVAEVQASAESIRKAAAVAWRDSQAVSDGFRRFLTMRRRMVDVVGGTDASRRRVRMAMADQMAASEFFGRQVAFLRAHADKVSSVEIGRRRGLKKLADEQAVYDAARKTARFAGLETVGVSEAWDRVWTAARSVADRQDVAALYRSKPKITRTDIQAVEDSRRFVWNARRVVAEVQALIGERRTTFMALLARETQEIEDGLSRRWSAVRMFFADQAVSVRRFVNVMPRRVDSVAAEDAHPRFGISVRKSEVQVVQERRSMAFWRSFEESQAVAELRRMRPMIGWMEIQPVEARAGRLARLLNVEEAYVSDVLKTMGKVFVCDVPLMEESFGRTWQAYRSWSDEAQVAEGVRKWFRRAPFLENQAVDASFRKRPRVYVIDGNRVRDSLSRIWQAAKSIGDVATPVERYSRHWRADRSFADEVGTADSMSKWPRLPFGEVQRFAESTRRAWTIVRRASEDARVRDADRRRFMMVRSDRQAVEDASRQAWRAMRVLSEPSYVSDGGLRKWVGSRQADAAGLGDSLARTWNAFRGLADAPRVIDRRSMRSSVMRSDALAAEDAVAKGVRAAVADAQAVADRPIRRAFRAVVREASQLIDSIFRWNPTKIRRYGFRTWFSLLAKSLGFNRSARTLPFEFSVVWEGERVLHMVSGESRAVRVRVEAAEGEAFVIDEASVEVVDERTNEQLSTGAADVDGHKVSYLFAPPAAGVYTLVFTMRIGPQTIKHRETVRVVD